MGLMRPGLAPLLLAAAVTLSGCGYKGAVTRLEPPDPALTREQQKEARRVERRQVAEGLTVPANARPQRVDDLTVKLEVREDNPFSLPPEGTRSSRAVPFPGEEAETLDRPLPMPPPAPAPARTPD